MIASLLVANRGEIARRIIRTARALGIRTVAGYADVDVDLPFVAEADEAVPLPGAGAAAYRDVDALIGLAAARRVQAVHPGYGFLSENADAACAFDAAGLLWVGPSADVIATMGDKIAARQAAMHAGVPVVPGSAALTTAAQARSAAMDVGFPVMVKAAGGGGGMGMAVVETVDELDAAFDKVSRVAERLFGDPRVFVERYVRRARHIEVQVVGLPDGSVRTLGERDCSVQRRNQKLVEESPSPAVDGAMRERITGAARLLAEGVGYRNAGTVEMIFDVDRSEFYFLEMNTRIQVEHPVTEEVFGVDLVGAQLAIAAGQVPDLPDGAARGHAVEFRVNAEDPVRFLPKPGAISRWEEPSGAGIRVDAGYRAGNRVTPAFDSLMAKLIVHGTSRSEALARARQALAGFVVEGPGSTLPFYRELLDVPDFVSGDYDTGLVRRLRPRA